MPPPLRKKFDFKKRDFKGGRGSSGRGGDRKDRGGDRKDRRGDRDGFSRMRSTAKFKLQEGEKIEYKNIPLLQRFLNDRGKILPRRITGITAKEQRRLTEAVKRARFLALLTTGGVK